MDQHKPHTLDTLVELAEAALMAEGPTDGILDRIEAYSKAFGSWYEGAAAGAIEFEKDSAAHLLELHERVVARIGDLTGTTSAEMAVFKRRTKGIMAYADLLPKRISIAKNRKG